MTTEMILSIAAVAVSGVSLLLLIIVLVKQSRLNMSEILDLLRDEVRRELRETRDDINKETSRTLGLLATTLTTTQKNSFDTQNERINELNRSVTRSLSDIQRDNNEKLEKMRVTVDEKLQKTLEERLGQSFKLVNDQLQEVYKGLGEMKTLATGVGDLKKVLSNVKTRGILGEIQLGSILEQILSPEQYEVNAATKPGSRERVEYAVKMPSENGAFTYLPIDAKFPVDLYTALVDSYDTSDPAAVEAAWKQLEGRVKQEAKKIHDLYVEPPYTTEFAVMFLPTEGLYAEVVRRGMIEQLQRDYHITIAGPTTLSALLNSLQMGFRTLAIQQRSNEIWETLCSVKVEFNKFGGVLEKTQKKLTDASDELETLVGTRTRKMQKRLEEVTTLPGHGEPALIPDTDD